MGEEFGIIEFKLDSDFNIFSYSELGNNGELKSVYIFIFEKELCVLLIILFIRNIMI